MDEDGEVPSWLFGEDNVSRNDDEIEYVFFENIENTFRRCSSLEGFQYFLASLTFFCRSAGEKYYCLSTAII